MPGKPFVLMWAAADTEETLKARYLAEVHAQRRQWLHGLWLLRRGWRVDAVADAVGAGRRTVERWIDWYRSGGLDGVLAHRQGGDGRPPRLSVAQQEQVGDAVASGRFRTAAEIGAWIAANSRSAGLSSGLYGGTPISGTPMRATRWSMWPGAPSQTMASSTPACSIPRTTAQNSSPFMLSSQQYQMQPVRTSTATNSARYLRRRWIR